MLWIEIYYCLFLNVRNRDRIIHWHHYEIISDNTQKKKKKREKELRSLPAQLSPTRLGKVTRLTTQSSPTHLIWSRIN